MKVFVLYMRNTSFIFIIIIIIIPQGQTVTVEYYITKILEKEVKPLLSSAVDLQQKSL